MPWGPYSHLDAAALTQPGGFMDAATQTVARALQSGYGVADRADERAHRAALLAIADTKDRERTSYARDLEAAKLGSYQGQDPTLLNINALARENQQAVRDDRWQRDADRATTELDRMGQRQDADAATLGIAPAGGEQDPRIQAILGERERRRAIEDEDHQVRVAERKARALAAVGRATGAGGGAGKPAPSAIDRWKELAAIARQDLGQTADGMGVRPTEEQVTGKVKAMLRQVIETGTHSEADVALARTLGVPTTVVRDQIVGVRSLDPAGRPVGDAGRPMVPAMGAEGGMEPWRDATRRPFARAQALLRMQARLGDETTKAEIRRMKAEDPEAYAELIRFGSSASTPTIR
jgi:hypothetical protein